jgi:glucose/arabinose dehydrogenase
MSKIFCLAICFAVTAIACNDSHQPAVESDHVDSVRNGDTVGGPVETESPNSKYKPAFPGQTRINRVITKTPYEATVITSDLKSPWGIAVMPDGRFLITQKTGTMRIVTAEGKPGNPITGLLPVNSKAQGGLLGLTLDPSFASNRMVYWVFSEDIKKGTLTSVAKGRLSNDEQRIENATVIYRATPEHNSNLHYGGRILFDKTGNLIVSTGERSDIETRPLAQSLNAGLGKIVRITTSGQPASGNPFAGQNNVRPEIYSYGHRNVQGLAWNPETGDLWENEFGPRGGDELNLIKAGKNYGWPTITYGIEYSGGKVGDAITQKEGLEQPVYYWDPVVSPSGMTFYNSDNIPEWKNNLFIAALNKPHIVRLVIKNNKVTGEERLLEKESQRFRDIAVGKDGALYAVTDAGRMYRIGKK